MSALSRGYRAPLTALAMLLIVALGLPKALAETSARPAPGITMPRVKQVPQLPLSSAAKRAGLRDARIILLATINKGGRVVSAEVLEGAGYGLDEAAREALLHATFHPALRNGDPIKTRVKFAYHFEPEEPAPAIHASLVGQVVDATEQPQPGVRVLVRASDGTAREVLSAADGRFTVEGLPAGAAAITLVREDSDATRDKGRQLQLRVGQRTTIVLTLAAPATPRVVDVEVTGYSPAETLRRSAQAVTVLELQEAKRQGVDLGDALARTEGVGVRRSGGLGSDTRFSLNGLTDSQVRFFYDGVPLDLAGYPFGISNVPVNLIDRVEIYRGVVPISLGADALGGAVNLVTDEIHGSAASASYQVGSFGTYRGTVAAHHIDEATGLYARLSGFYDHANNDYPIDVQVPNALGQLSDARVYRFHDRYRARGANVEVGIRDRDWAEHLSLRGFYADMAQQLQHNVVMTVPYGDVHFGRLTGGGSLRYRVSPVDKLTVDVVGAYGYNEATFVDVGSCVYDWFGHCIRERPVPGEIDVRPRDQVQFDHGVYARAQLIYEPFDPLTLRLSVAPSYFTRTGEERRLSDPTARDPLSAKRQLLAVVSGLSATMPLLDDKLENITFGKIYHQDLNSEEPLPGGTFRRRDRVARRVGVGNAFRYRFFEGLTAKASYEYATRLPNPQEVFGNAALIVANLELAPEVSHNVNLGAYWTLTGSEAGDFRASANGFLRETDQLIVLLGNDRVFSFQNVFSARSMGVEGAAGWTSPGGWAQLDGNATYMDFRNTSGEGTFGDFEGDRIPNRPFLFANGSGSVRVTDLAARYDRLSLQYDLRFVGGFFRGWESIGLSTFKQTVDQQLTHALSLLYLYRKPGRLEASGALEVHNLTDARVFDFFGVQRPGRAFFFKGTVSWQR